MKIVKKILYVIPLLLGILLVYGVLSGSWQEKINKLENEIDVKKTEEEENETIEIPEGKIVLKDYFKSWEEEPKIEVYDPNNKVAKNGVYGLTKDEYEYRTKLGYEQIEIDENTDIPEEYKGEIIYNKEKLVDWGEEFEIQRLKATYVYDNLRIMENFKGLDEKYYTDYKKELLSVLDENGEIQNNISTGENSVETETYNYKLVMFDVTIIPKSDWVTEGEVVPELWFVDDKEKALIVRDDFYEFGDLTPLIYSGKPIYYDLGLYDLNKHENDELIFVSPMRKGEIINFTVGYIIPEELFDKVCFAYNPNCHIATEFSYLTEDIAIFQLKEREDNEENVKS